MGDFKQIVVNEEITSQEYWREQHIKLLLLLSVFAVAMEIFAFFLMNILSLNQTSNKMYFIKYILFPALSYFVIDAFVVGIYRNRKISKAFKNYAISIGMVAFITILYLAHDSFPIIFASGIIVILLTSVYSNPKLTAIVAVLASLSAVLVGTFSTFNNVKVVDSTYLLSVFIAVLLHLAAYICCYCIILNNHSVYKRIVKREKETKSLRHEAIYDELTGLQNRNGLRDYFNTHTENLCVAMIDIDNFKNVNDTWGHQKGDEVLISVGSIFRNHTTLHNSGVECFRYGGDEFILLFYEWPISSVQNFCTTFQIDFSASLPEKIRKANCGISYGIAKMNKGETPSEVIHKADHNLYIMKNTKKMV